MQLVKRVWDYSTNQDLLRDGDRVVVGVSGGPDSLCLLDVLHKLATKHRLKLLVAHLNHSLRPDAEAEADFVRAEAARRGVDLFSETVDVQSIAQANKQSIETAARELRYAFFWRVAGKAGAQRVAVAHTADDQAETVLMHLLRGAGLRGLRGMAPKRPLGEPITGKWAEGPSMAPVDNPWRVANDPEPIFLVRPLLTITRDEIMAHCRQHHLVPRTDETNTDVRYFRNRLRHELLPVLDAYNPNIRAVLARTASAAAGDYDIWLGAIQRLWLDTVRSAPGDTGQIAFDRARWLALTAAEQRALLRTAADHLAGYRDEIDFAPLEAAVQFSRGAAPGRSCRLAGGLVLRVDAAHITLSGPPAIPVSGDWPRVVDGALAAGWRLVLEPLGARGWQFEQVAAAPRWVAYVDAERLVLPIQFRARRPGDRFQPLGLGGQTVKLSDFLVNQKIPVHQRGQWPLVTCGDSIVWVVGLRLDERYKVTDSTRLVTRLSVTRMAEE